MQAAADPPKAAGHRPQAPIRKDPPSDLHPRMRLSIATQTNPLAPVTADRQAIGRVHRCIIDPNEHIILPPTEPPCMATGIQHYNISGRKRSIRAGLHP